MTTKKIKTAVAEAHITSTIKDSAQHIWMAGLGAFDKAQQGGNKVFEALLREGESIQEMTRKATEDKVAEMTAKATGTWDKLEQVFEQRVAVALRSLGVPTRQDVDALSKRVKELSVLVEKLQASPAKVVRRAKKAD